ncbi:MAG: hypothetical protein H5T73_12205 [Actinobacteria bacterium]|nr:hypothetical protein [Actinomycetota bacterium]
MADVNLKKALMPFLIPFLAAMSIPPVSLIGSCEMVWDDIALRRDLCVTNG